MGCEYGFGRQEWNRITTATRHALGDGRNLAFRQEPDRCTPRYVVGFARTRTPRSDGVQVVVRELQRTVLMPTLCRVRMPQCGGSDEFRATGAFPVRIVKVRK
jgi:hypothetical protein